MEQKKRFRPTLTAYRALENEVMELRKSVDTDLVAKCKKLKEELTEVRANCVHTSIFDEMVNKNRTLEQSNKHLEDEINRLREHVNGATDDYHKARREVLWLRNRNLWQRIINAGYKE
jgi:ribosome recycling factor